MERDPLLAPVFGGPVTKEHREHVTAWWAEVMGGPDVYSEQHGGYEHMLAMHRGVARRADGVRRVGHPSRRRKLGAGSRAGATRTRSAMGLGRGAAVPAVSGFETLSS